MPCVNAPCHTTVHHQAEPEVKLERVTELSSDRLAELAHLDRQAFGAAGLRVYELAVLTEAGLVLQARLAGGECVGGCQLIRECDRIDTLWVVGIYIVPKWQNRGVGTLFLRSLIEKLPQYEASGLRLTVDRENIPAVRLYERVGFLPVDQVDEFYGPGEDRLVMEWRTSAGRLSSPANKARHPLPQPIESALPHVLSI